MIERVVLDGIHGRLLRRAREALAREFPGVRVSLRFDPEQALLLVTSAAWNDPAQDVGDLDRRVLAAADGARRYALVVFGESAAALATGRQVLSRYQRLFPQTNAASRLAGFVAARLRLRSWHDLGDPEARAVHDHAVDCWQWVLRLEPAASLALQLAALLHDADRSLGGRDERAPDRDAHAERAAALVPALLAGLSVPEDAALRAVHLIGAHEAPCDDESRTLAEADALSFLSLSSASLLARGGRAVAAREVARALSRMRPAARARLAAVRLAPEVLDMVSESFVRRVEDRTRLGENDS